MSRVITTGSSVSEVTTMSFKLRMISVTSSVMPSIVSNSCNADSNLTVVMAAPGIDERSMRRIELPMVWPRPGSNGPIENFCRLFSATPMASTVGR